MQQEILELCNEDIEIDDDNEALPENLQPLTEEEASNIVQNNWEPPTICPQISSGLRNTKGRWVNHEWADVKIIRSLICGECVSPLIF